MDSQREFTIRRRIAAGAAALSIALAGAAWSGCGDDDAEQAAEDVQQEAGQAAEDVQQEAEEQIEESQGEEQTEDSQGEAPGY